MADNDARQQAEEWYLTVSNFMPQEAWYAMGLGAVFASLSLLLVGERDWSTFVGQLAPVFLLLGLFHRRPPLGR